MTLQIKRRGRPSKASIAERDKLVPKVKRADTEVLADLRDRFEMLGKLTVAKLNIDENPNTPGRYGVRGIPTLMIFKDGKVAATKVGALPKQRIVEWINSAI